MLQDHTHRGLTGNRNRSAVSTRAGAFAAASRVTVLLFLMAGHGAARGEDVHVPDLSVFQFSCRFYFLVGPGHLEGLMVSNGSQHRIAVYWIDPEVFRESTSFVRYSDFIFASDGVHYWLHPGTTRGTLASSAKDHDPLLPREYSPEAIVRSALAIVRSIDDGEPGGVLSLEVGRFFHGGRGLPKYAYEAMQEPPDGKDPPAPLDPDVQTLNVLPGGRRYSKDARVDGAVVWHVGRTSSGPPVATVIVKRATPIPESDCPGVFDPGTLGRWTLVPESYRAYWSFDRAFSELRGMPDSRAAGCALHDRIESHLNENNLPVGLRRALHRLGWKAALATGDTDRVRRSVQAAVSGLFEDASMSRYRAFLELAWIGGEVEQRHPEQPQEWLRDLVGQMVKHVGGDIGSYVERLLPTIGDNRWFTYGALLLDEVRRQGVMEEGKLKQTAVRFEAMRLAGDTKPPGPAESSARVRDYLARLDTDPPRGPLDVNAVRHILEQGLEKYCKSGGTLTNRDLAEDIVRSVRLVVGDGPFCGNPEELAAATARFSECFLAIYGRAAPIDTVLATFLALSFCDISTPEDHAVLVAQFHGQCVAVQSEINTMLTEGGLGALVGPNDVARAFRDCEQTFGAYIDDPLWPPFKFPLTSHEEARLAGRLKLRLARLGPILEEISLKVKYGGASAQLRERTVSEISYVPQQLLTETAWLRSPAYPGVSCHYRARCGFTAAIMGPLYTEGDRPKEKFKAMKYFHLGHRLQNVVERERELTSRAKKQEMSQ